MLRAVVEKWAGVPCVVEPPWPSGTMHFCVAKAQPWPTP
jgi:hypothetical protein